jgi:deazaflavin-dependent oxidoreductase (nitroreductase family)
MQTLDPPLPALPTPPLADPPRAERVWARLDPYARQVFPLLNRRVMIPAHRAGLAAWIATPIGGYILLLRVRGRTSGMVREVPLSYLVRDGSVWVMAGLGRRTHWYRNLLVHPSVELCLPGRRLHAIAREEADAVVRRRVLPSLARAAGLPGLLGGVNPWTAGDDRIMREFDWVPLVRFDPITAPAVAGADDPGGRAWLWRQAVILVGVIVARRLVRRFRDAVELPEAMRAPSGPA